MRQSGEEAEKRVAEDVNWSAFGGIFFAGILRLRAGLGGGGGVKREMRRQPILRISG